MDTSGSASRRHGMTLRENSFATFGYYSGFINCSGYGVYAAYNSFIDGKNIDVSGSGLCGVCVRHASKFIGRDDGNGSAPKANNCDIGLEADWASFIFFRNGEAENCKSYGAMANSKSVINAHALKAKGAGIHGFYIQNGSEIHAPNSDVSEAVQCGVRGLAKSSISAKDIKAINCGTEAISVTGLCDADVTSGALTGAGNYGILAFSNCRIEAAGADARYAGLHGVRGLAFSAVNFQNGKAVMNTNGTEQPNDIRVTTGSTINANGASGGTHQPVNQLTANGIIFK